MNGYRVTPEFFRVYGIRPVERRTFQPGDSADPVIVSRSMATQLWPTTSAIGRTMSFDRRTIRVVGVTREVLTPALDPRSDEPELYEPLIGETSFYVTTRCGAGCPPLETVRARLRAASSAATVGPGRYVRDAYAEGLERPRASAVIAVAFAAIALVAVAAGLFAVLSRVALQRQREFGIRLALGATPVDLQRLVYSSSLWIAATGIGTGVILAWTLGRILAAVQYRVRVDDPLTWAVVIAVVTATALAAAWHPARQAMRANPIALLRQE